VAQVLLGLPALLGGQFGQQGDEHRDGVPVLDAGQGQGDVQAHHGVRVPQAVAHRPPLPGPSLPAQHLGRRLAAPPHRIFQRADQGRVRLAVVKAHLGKGRLDLVD
jgi:hypothetical protein